MRKNSVYCYEIYKSEKVNDRLVAIVQGQFELDVFTMDGFCFVAGNVIEGLLWERDRFLLLYKRFDNGKFQWSQNEIEARLLTE